MKYKIKIKFNDGHEEVVTVPNSKLQNKLFNAMKKIPDIALEIVNEPEMVERINLMSGKKYMEEKDTPLYMSPSSESYWSS